jgi:regulator of replication initiation timing
MRNFRNTKKLKAILYSVIEELENKPQVSDRTVRTIKAILSRRSEELGEMCQEVANLRLQVKDMETECARVAAANDELQKQLRVSYTERKLVETAVRAEIEELGNTLIQT